MGKNHNKDAMYIKASEWASEWGGKKTAGTTHAFKRLPFNCCALSMRPFDDPVCTPGGDCFDVSNIIPYLKANNQKNPVTGLPLSVGDLFPLNFHKNVDGDIICPILQKVFTDNSVIVAIKTSGHVYSKEAVSRLNFATKNLCDLISGETFTRADVITLQDPNDKSRVRAIDKSEHMRQLKQDASEAGVTKAVGMKRMFGEVAKQVKPQKRQAATDDSSSELVGGSVSAPRADIKQLSHYSTGAASGSFTSTAVPLQTKQTLARKSEATIRSEFYATVKKKAYMRMSTTLGDINLELHADICPRACENFVVHAKDGYYNHVGFHRNIEGFMLQGGDPTGTGKGGESIWEKTGEMPGLMGMAGEGGLGGMAMGAIYKKGNGKFEDEIREKLKHAGRGILSMANSGPGTNGSQFFLTYARCPHLDGKHTIFGRVVGGLPVLDKMEAVPTDADDRPRQPITILKMTVFVDPFEEARVSNVAAVAAELAAQSKVEFEKNDPDAKRKGGWMSNPSSVKPVARKSGGVGKYLAKDAFK